MSYIKINLKNSQNAPPPNTDKADYQTVTLLENKNKNSYITSILSGYKFPFSWVGENNLILIYSNLLNGIFKPKQQN